MNTADLCAEARELYAAYLALKGKSFGLIQVERAVNEAYRRWREHVEECELCESTHTK